MARSWFSCPRTPPKTSSLPAVLSVYSLAADLVDPPDLRWRRDPVSWAHDRLGVELWSKQREILESVRDHRMTAVHSCHGVGKSFSAALTVAWWLSVHPPNKAFVVTTAPTEPQVKAILWREINRMHRAGNLLGRTNLKEWYINGAQVGIGRKPSDHNPDAFQGIHDPYVLVVIDEACGVDASIWNAASSLITGEDCRILAIGNPDDPQSEFAAVCGPSSGWNKIHISAFHSPNFTGEKVSAQLAKQLVTKTWVDERTAAWGTGTPLYTSKVEGNFSEDSANGLINLSWLRACRELGMIPGMPVEAGIDVGAGGDRTVIRERRGMKAGREDVFVDADPLKTVNRLVDRIIEWGIQKVKVDSIGVGHHLVGTLRAMSKRYTQKVDGVAKVHDALVQGVNFGEKPMNPLHEARFLNVRAETWWEIGREYSRKGLWDLSNVDDEVFDELIAPGYEILDAGGKIKIEKKDDVIKRLKRSPDRADALLLAFIGAGTQSVSLASQTRSASGGGR